MNRMDALARWVLIGAAIGLAWVALHWLIGW